MASNIKDEKEIKDPKTRMLAARITEEEHAMISGVAESLDMSLSDLIREGALAVAKSWDRRLKRSRRANPPMGGLENGKN